MKECATSSTTGAARKSYQWNSGCFPHQSGSVRFRGVERRLNERDRVLAATVARNLAPLFLHELFISRESMLFDLQRCSIAWTDSSAGDHLPRERKKMFVPYVCWSKYNFVLQCMYTGCIACTRGFEWFEGLVKIGTPSQRSRFLHSNLAVECAQRMQKRAFSSKAPSRLFSQDWPRCQMI